MNVPRETAPTWKQRYHAAHDLWQQKEYPASYRDHGSLPTQYPDVRKSNGLTRMILYFLKWSGWRATRVNTVGRLIDSPQKQQSGISLMTKKFIPSTTRRGQSDVSSTIFGRSVMWEIKIGDDAPSEYQLREQELERKAGGEYFFVSNPDEFFKLYDDFLLTLK